MGREEQLQEMVERELLRRMRGRLPTRMTSKLRRELAAVMVAVLDHAIDDAVQVRVLCLVTGGGAGVSIRAAVQTTKTQRTGEGRATVIPFPAAKAGA